MSIVKEQDKQVIIGSPIEVEKACADIREQLINIPWLDRSYLIAEKFLRKEKNKKFYFPETYVGETNGKKKYFRITPDNDFMGRSFFVLGDGKIEFNRNGYNKIKYPLGIVFSVNLELIDPVRLQTELFTQELVRDVRRVLTETSMFHENFTYELTEETRDLKRVFKEFILNDIEDYNRAPMQCFRINMIIEVYEECL